MKQSVFRQKVSKFARNIKKLPVEVVFLILATTFGLAFMIVVPPFQVPDEPAHFLKSYQISRLGFVQQNVGNTSGGVLPKGLTDLSRIADEGNVSMNAAAPYHYRTKLKELWAVKLGSEVKPVEYSTLATYPPVAYIPQAIGVGLSSLFTDKVIVLFYTGRIVNLAVMIFLLWLAIRITPRGKLVIAIIGLMPMTLFVGASLSADAFTIGITALFAALLTRMYYMEEITTKQWLTLGAVAALLGLSKQGYYLLIAAILVLIFRNSGKWFVNKFELKKRLIWIAGIISFVGACLLAWRVMDAGVSSDVSGIQLAVGHAVSASVQTERLLHNPLHLLHMLANTLLGYAGNGIIGSFFGVFGWLNVPLPDWAMYMLAITLFLAFGVSEDLPVRKPRWTAVWLIVAVCGLTMLAIFGILYILWTATSSTSIEGFQGRYMIPLLLLAAPFLAGQYSHTIRRRFILASSVIVLVASLLTLFARY